MNDQHPHAGYDTDATQTTGSYTVDPLFGTYAETGYDAGQSGHTQYAQYDYGHTGQWDANAYGSYTATAQWDATAWTGAQPQQSVEYGQWTTPGYDTGAYDAAAWNQVPAEPLVPQQYTPEPAAEYAYDPAAYQGPYDEQYQESYQEQYQESYEQQPQAPEAGAEPEHAPDAFHDAETMIALELDPDLLGAGYAEDETAYDGEHDDAGLAAAPAPAADVAHGELPARSVRRSGGGSRGRRRTPAKRSALLTVAVPSACVMGVAGIAAASVGGLTDSGGDTKDDTTSMAAADPASVKQVAANSKLDTQLAALSADARDFGDRASRTQERIDLKLRQEAERKKREEEAARKEALRPKYLLPVKLHQLSARFGQAGVNWMSLHTGIDFPVQYGTPVMSATDGTVRTQWNSAYGNMAIVTSPDGTETWYCHLSSTKIRSGQVKAGDVIAYSGNSGNSTGPHLHFEVRPNGGAAIDPLPWLLSHGLDPLS
ncbi:peptidoglycan DD-metalloendopeptidase family protein [Streptomyces sp. NPDC004267]|uniref:M23 family metallopeptidase n=1 Tax=Streptomyces sp. NPDC004267 TaxID=3364694 RepID=UPI003696F59C